MSETKPEYKTRDDLEETIRLPNPASQSMKELVADIESCEYRCEAGRLELNIAWLEIRRRAERAWQDEQAITLAADLFEAAMGYYQGNVTYPGLLERLQKVMKRE